MESTVDEWIPLTQKQWFGERFRTLTIIDARSCWPNTRSPLRLLLRISDASYPARPMHRLCVWFQDKGIMTYQYRGSYTVLYITERNILAGILYQLRSVVPEAGIKGRDK